MSKAPSILAEAPPLPTPFLFQVVRMIEMQPVRFSYAFRRPLNSWYFNPVLTA